MYLCQAIRNFEGTVFPMAGVIPADAVMGKKRNALGYVKAAVVCANLLSTKGQTLRGHEFHWSHLQVRPGFEKLKFAYRTTSRLDNQSKPDGILIENLLASYTHLHFAHMPEMANRLIGRLQSVSA